MLKKTCKISGKKFKITDSDLEFYKKMGVPEPTLCPDERQRRRLAWRNERNLYHRTCTATGKKIISIYSAEKKFPVYNQGFWWSDKWNALDYGKNFDFTKTFFENFSQLIQTVPRLSIINKKSKNSEYNNYSLGNENCYLTFGMHFNEDALYSHYGTKNKNIGDCFRVSGCELCYECIDCQNCYNCAYLQDSKNCQSSSFLKNCIGCSYCFGSVNLRNKKYYFNNQKHSKEEYLKKIKNITLEKKFQKNFFEFSKKFPHLYMEGIVNENSSGNYLSHTKNLSECFDSDNCEDCQFGAQMDNTKFSQDMNCMGYEPSELCYMTIGCAGLYNCAFVDSCWNNSDIFYSNLCFSSEHLFGCVGLKNSKYCILNKQYTKEKYFEMREKIIEHMTLRLRSGTAEWGEFFPISLSPFGYEETVAQEYFPLEKSAVRAKNFSPLQKYQGPKITIPEKISETSDKILKQILTCVICEKNYRIVKPELEFYKKMDIPVPHNCPNCRHLERMKLRNPRKLYKRTCDNLSCRDKLQFVSTFAPEREEKVFCEECYLEKLE